MILAIDVHYKPSGAKSVGLTFQDWQSEAPQQVLTSNISEVKPYVPGAFYQRELPCLMSIIEQTNLDDIATIVIDGYVTLSNENKPGLGAYLHQALEHKVKIIGVAKTNFYDHPDHTQSVFRGESQKPLFVTSAGIAPEIAALCIKIMAGPHRIPKMLSLVDQYTKMD